MSVVSLPVPPPRADAARALVVALLVLLPPIVWLSRRFPNVFFEDDAYFYLQIAWNLGAGAGSTFDGLNITNGYHLLWTGILVPLAWLAHAVGLGKVGLVALAVAAALTLAILSIWSTFSGTLERALALLLVLLCGLTMESVVLASLLLVGVRAIEDERASPPWWLLSTAVLVPLARIDFCFVMPALALVARARDPARARWVGLTVAATLLGVALQIGLEHFLFGSFTSVSSAYKSDIARARGGLPLLVENLRSRGNQLRVLALVAVAGLGLVPSKARPRAWLAVPIAAAPVAVHLVLSELRDWYVLASLELCLFYAVRSGAPERLRRLTFLSVGGVLALASAAYIFVMREDMVRTAAFLRAAERVLAPTDMVYQVDGAGFTGFWLPAHVVNGDGLVNSWAYRARLKADRLDGYLATIGARYVLTNEPTEEARVVDHHGLVVPRASVELLIDAGETRHPHAHFRLYALRD